MEAWPALLRAGAGGSFFELVRMIEAYARPGTPLGAAGSPAAAEAVRFRANADLGFPSRDVHAVVARDERVELSVNFLTLVGVDSPLAPYLTEQVMADGREGDTTLRDFLDLLHHRLLSLLYRSWAEARPYVRWERTGAPLPLDALAEGISLPAIPAGLDPGRFAQALGLFAHAHRSGPGLLALLRWLWPEVPVELAECAPRLVDVPPEQRSRLGAGRARLLVDAVLGGRVWEANASFVLRVGPVPTALIDHYRPGAARRAQLVAVVDLWLRTPHAWDLEVWWQAEDLQPAQLGRGAKLGRDAWLGRPRDTVATRMDTTRGGL